MKRIRLIFLACFFVTFVLTTTLSAQITLDVATVASGGGSSSGGPYTLFATIGQSTPPANASGGSFTLQAGFIPAAFDTSDCLASISSVSPIAGPVTAGNAVTVTAVVNDTSCVGQLKLFYRAGGGNFISEGEMSLVPGSESYTKDIPNAAVGDEGVEYYVQIEDENGVSSDGDIVGLTVTVADPGPESGILRSGNEVSNYQLIAAPMNKSNNTRKDVIEDDLGAQGNEKWRMFDENRQSTNSATIMNAGTGFFLIVAESGKTFDTGAGTTVQTVAPFTRQLDAGWSLLGNPYAFVVPAGNITLVSTGQMVNLRSFNGDWTNMESMMQPFEAYAVYLADDGTVQINPATSGTANMPIVDPLENSDWYLQVVAKFGSTQDSQNFLGLHSEATIEYDELDWPEPPKLNFGHYVAVSFPHPDWQQPVSEFSRDIRKKIEEAEVWGLQVETNVNDRVELTFDNIASIPQDLAVYLVDPLINASQNLRDKQQYEFAASREHAQRDFQIVIGNPAAVENLIGKEEAIPEDFYLDHNFPNPFNPATTIRFGLPRQEKVSLIIYNVVGQEVVRLYDIQTLPAGNHFRVWDGRNGNGQRVASGIYIYHLKAGDTRISRRMSLVK